MFKKLTRGFSTSGTDPQVKIFLRDLQRYPGDELRGVVQLFLPAETALALLEVQLTGTEIAQLGGLGNKTNFEARQTLYYEQFITLLGHVPEKVAAQRSAATAKSRVKLSAGEEVTRTRRAAPVSSMHKKASLQAVGADELVGSPTDDATEVFSPAVVNDSQMSRMAAGMYTFPFRVSLPITLPPSGRLSNGHDGMCRMFYTACARLVLRAGKVVKQEVPFRMEALPLQLQRWLQLHRNASSPKIPGVPEIADWQAPGSPAGTARAGDFDLENASDDDGDGDDGTASVSASHAASVATVTTANSGGSGSKAKVGIPGEHDRARVLRRCIDHRLRFSEEYLAHEDEQQDLAEKAAAQPQPPAAAAPSKKPKRAAAEEDDTDAVHAMDKDDVGDMREPKNAQKAKTRMVAAEIDRLGFGPPSSPSSSADNSKNESAEEDDKQSSSSSSSSKAFAEDADGAASPTTTASAAAAGAAPHHKKHRAHPAPPPLASAQADGEQPDERPPSRTLREPLWEQEFLIPVRDGLMSKSTLPVTLILHSNVLVSGRDKLRASLIVDNTNGSCPVSKVRYSLIVRQMIRTRAEKMRFSRVEAEMTTAEPVKKGKVARLPMVELPVPASTPVTRLTDGGYAMTFLSVRLYCATALKTFSRSAELEVLVVSAVDTKNQSRRLRRWTNYFVGYGIPRHSESAPTIDLTAANAHPKLLESDEAAAAQEEEINRSVMGDRYTPSLSGSIAQSTRSMPAGSKPSSPSFWSRKMSRMFSSKDPASPTSPTSPSSPESREAREARRTMNFESATFLPLSAMAAPPGPGSPAAARRSVSGASSPAAAATSSNAGGVVNPLMAPSPAASKLTSAKGTPNVEERATPKGRARQAANDGEAYEVEDYDDI